MRYALEAALDEFGCESTVVGNQIGPVVETWLVKPGKGVRVRKLVSIEEDLALRLNVAACRIETNIPDGPYLGVEVPRTDRKVVPFSPTQSDAELPMSLGTDTLGRPVTLDLAKAPHLLVAGATGSGKSVAVHTILCSLVQRHTPDRLRLILIDPKMLEFTSYRGLPHLLQPVITEAHEATKALSRAVGGMESRYKLLAEYGCRDIKEYHVRGGKMPYVVIVVDEWADLFMQEGKTIEKHVVRLAQKARACGIHIVLATQRPTVKVLSGLIKANFPARMALKVTNKTDSRVVLDANGAESLLGRGDMLISGLGLARTTRVHGSYVDPDKFFGIK